MLPETNTLLSNTTQIWKHANNFEWLEFNIRKKNIKAQDKSTPVED